MTPDELKPKQIYTWDDLSGAFEFEPEYFRSAGGMISRPKLNALLLITHPGGAKSFDYNDYWEGDDLIYTGRGKQGDQSLSGRNKYVAENSHLLYVFEAGHGSRRLKFLGIASCKEWKWGTGPDSERVLRRVLQFRLQFPSSTSDEPTSPVSNAVGRAKFFGGGESDAHKQLKNYVAEHPEVIGLPASATPFVEHSFRSPDRADIVFQLDDDRRVAVEIELEGGVNTLIGGWQAVKYRTLLCLESNEPLGSPKCACVLVAKSIPASTQEWCQRYGVACFEITPLQ